MAMATWAMLGEGRELLVLLRKALRENTRMKRAERTERWHIRLNAASRDKGRSTAHRCCPHELQQRAEA
jgi:Leu/Phe-tRNA-protein transferase